MKKNLKKTQAVWLGMGMLGMFALGMIVFAIEGLICILMSSSIAFFFYAFGLLGRFAVGASTSRLCLQNADGISRLSTDFCLVRTGHSDTKHPFCLYVH